MVMVSPFKALRYDTAKTEGLTTVLAPPYDVISPEMQEELYERSPFNLVRLELGKQFDTDQDTDNRYTRATADFNQWRKDGVLRRDQQDSLYVVRQKFSYGGVTQKRIAVTAVLKFSEDGSLKDSVYPHEKTLSGPKQDRTRLLEAIPANLSPVFCVYPDEGAVMQKALETVVSTDPQETAELPDQQIEIWTVSDADFIRLFQDRLARTAVLIADGHHRFSVAHANRERFGGVMANFVSMEDPGLVVWPIHRIVNLEKKVEWDRIREFCDLESVADLDSALEWLQAEETVGRFVVSDAASVYRAELKESVWKGYGQEGPLDLLDTTLLKDKILPGIGASQTTYIADPHRALRFVKSGEADLAWYVRAVPLNKVYDMAKDGQVMPPKTTYFYPKMVSGVTINPFE